VTITNGYATLTDLKERLLKRKTYTAATISFAAGTKIIADSVRGLKRFHQAGDSIRITGSVSNNGYYTIVTGNNPAQIVVSEGLVDEAAGATVTISDVSDQADDAQLESVIEATSRWIDGYTGRRFYAASETRYYTAEWDDLLEVDDLLSVTSLLTDDDGDRVYETTWQATDYDLDPPNAVLDGRPYTAIYLAPNGNTTFPATAKGVKLTGSFGYATTAPPPIKEACLLAAERLSRRKDAIFGVTGSGDMGHVRAILSQDPDVMRLLWNYVKLGVRG
jgi:hypothetical protein